MSAIDLVKQELGDPSRLLPGAPVGGNSLVTLADPPKGLVLAHPLGLVTIAQKAVPFDVQIDRIGTKRLTEGTPKFTIDDVLVGSVTTSGREMVTDHFARGQFMELTEQQKLEGRSFETFTSGVRIGTTAYTVSTAGTPVKADYEVEILEPETVLNMHWKVVSKYREVLDAGTAVTLSMYGAAANSARATSDALHAGDVGRATVREAPMAVVDPGSLFEQVTMITGPASSEAIASQAASMSGGLVVEAYEVAR
jgi:hypothetical protein